MNPKQAWHLRYGAITPMRSTPVQQTRDRFPDFIGHGTGINRTRESVSLLASLGCRVHKVGDNQYKVSLKIYHRGRQCTKNLGIFSKSEFFELALTINPKLGKE